MVSNPAISTNPSEYTLSVSGACIGIPYHFERALSTPSKTRQFYPE